MARAEDFETTIDGALEQKVCIFHVFLSYVQGGHDVVNSDLHWVVIAPVIIKNGQCLAKIDVSVLHIPVHEVSLNQDAVELYRLSVQWA